MHDAAVSCDASCSDQCHIQQLPASRPATGHHQLQQSLVAIHVQSDDRRKGVQTACNLRGPYKLFVNSSLEYISPTWSSGSSQLIAQYTVYETSLSDKHEKPTDGERTAYIINY